MPSSRTWFSISARHCPFPEFAAEIRSGHSDVLITPRYREGHVTRIIQNVLDVLGTYDAHGLGWRGMARPRCSPDGRRPREITGADLGIRSAVSGKCTLRRSCGLQGELRCGRPYEFGPITARAHSVALLDQRILSLPSGPIAATGAVGANVQGTPTFADAFGHRRATSMRIQAVPLELR